MSFTNDCASLNFYKRSLKGGVEDYQISFNENHTTIADVLHITRDLFRQLIDKFSHREPKARLVAKVCFIHVNSVTNEMEERYYHFSSYQTERVLDSDEFYERHMMKIASRLDNFNINGSNLLIKNIQHIHILLTMKPFTQTNMMSENV